jgi:hypothetical protein
MVCSIQTRALTAQEAEVENLVKLSGTVLSCQGKIKLNDIVTLHTRLSARTIVSAEEKMGRYYRGGMGNIAKVLTRLVQSNHGNHALAR